MAEFKPMDVSLGLNGSHVLVTGSSGAIGLVVVQAFLSAGAMVSGVDKVEPQDPILHDHYRSMVADVTTSHRYKHASSKRDPNSESSRY